MDFRAHALEQAGRLRYVPQPSRLPWKNEPDFFQSLETSFCAERKKGLTLIEVMLAITILSVGAAVLLTATARCMAIATKARHYSTAHRLIQRVNTENPLTRGELEAGVESGTFDEDGYRWEREIIENENEDREGLYTVRTRVSWSMSGRDAFEESVAYLYVEPEEEATPIGRRR